ncbi:YceI family protein [Adhaeribacter arboris]|uniref:YceI family protein n=1 Tax=Adhaeribacter arboris TaxID=2072846 RepID=A0A2T2YD18_9BACT|nr:YceI family protein [Adhaeribacter arboris]PSR53393.1 YceI family protein [Adhaeribacter arboris]
MKVFLLLMWLLVLGSGEGVAQNRYFTRAGHIWFFSETPIENIEAHNKAVSSILSFDTGELVFSVNMKNFEFRKSLMQEHFNENFLETDKYPKGTFKGTITNIQSIDFRKDGVYPAKVTGTLTIHGVSRQVSADGTLDVKGNRIGAKSTFTITPQEYNIQIPLLVRSHIAKIIQINVDMQYEPYVAKQ